MKLGGRSTGHERGAWPVLLLLIVAVLLPTACVLWFLNDAIANQRRVVRQKFADAYRSQLLLLRERLDSYWEQRASTLDQAARNATGAALFRKLLELADSGICFDATRNPAYPAAPPLPTPEPASIEWERARRLEEERSPSALIAASAAYGALAESAKFPSAAARAWQAQARCLVRAGKKNEAITLAVRRFGQRSYGNATDLQGRVIAGDMLLMALQLMGPGDARSAPAAAALRRLLLDYDNQALPHSQRLFLMKQMTFLRLPRELAAFPSFDAEQLAARFLEAEPGGRAEPALRASALPDVWKLGSAGGRAIALFRTKTVLGQMQGFIGRGLPSDIHAAVTPPGSMPAQEQVLESVPAGPRLPGWQLSLYFGGAEPFEQLAQRQMGLYLWTAALVIAAVAILALLAGRAIQRQAQLARLKTDLAAAVSHELKTPLSSMRLLVDTLLDDSEFDPVKTREYLELISRENSRLSHLIENFLAFSRMERNKLVFDFRPTLATDVVHGAVAAVHERINGPECDFEVHVAPGLPPFRADDGALITVLVNLLDNAYKYSPGEKHIRLRAFAEPEHLCFEVEDSGVGLAPRELGRIFRKFYQVDRRLSRNGGGCGLGLSIVKFIIDAHGGRIEVESKPGKGSLFRVKLPYSPVAAEEVR